MIRLENVSMKYGNKKLYSNISLSIENGEILGIIGPSGCGKSTILRNILMLTPPTNGKIFLDDLEITASVENTIEARKKIGMVFQNFNLFSRLTSIENVMSGLVAVQKITKLKAFEKAMETLKSVGLADIADKYPGELSGGQKQRVALARTIAMNPDVILLDEPTSALDPTMIGEVETVIRMLASMKKTLVIVSHDLNLIESICTKVVFINDGRIFEEGPAKEIFESPKETVTRRFINGLRILKFDIESKNFDFIGMQTTVNAFAFKNAIPDEIKRKFQAVMEELCQMIVIQPKEDYHLHCSYEYDTKERMISGHIKFTGPQLNPESNEYMLSWPIIKMNTNDLTYEAIDKKGYTNRITLKIH